MTVSQGGFNRYEQLTSVRLVSTSNVAGTYTNGAVNDGVGATLTSASGGTLTIDSVVANVGDRVLLQNQTAATQNGIYVVMAAAPSATLWVLQRSLDCQMAAQVVQGMFVPVEAGSSNAGAIFTLVEPVPQVLGLSSGLLFTASPLGSGLGQAAAKNVSDNSKGILASVVDSGSLTTGNVLIAGDAAGSVEDSGIAHTKVVLVPSTITDGNLAVYTDVAAVGQNVAAINSVSTASAAPGTVRSILGQMTGSSSVMTSGNLVGMRGEVDYVGASGGFLYGVQGKLIPTGTLSGSSWNAAVFGQLDISAATVNAGQTACIWGDYGATSGTISDASGMRGVAMTNTTAAVLNAQDYRYGNATYLLELAGAGGTLNYYAAAGTGSGSAGNSTHCAAQQVIKIEINGSAAYIPVFTQNS